MFTVDGLENGIKGCRSNIVILEEAIEKERSTIVSYRQMIDDIERADEQMKEAEDAMHIEVVR